AKAVGTVLEFAEGQYAAPLDQDFAVRYAVDAVLDKVSAGVSHYPKLERVTVSRERIAPSLKTVSPRRLDVQRRQPRGPAPAHPAPRPRARGDHEPARGAQCAVRPDDAGHGGGLGPGGLGPRDPGVRPHRGRWLLLRGRG